MYTLYKPDNLKEKAPLVFVLHGYTSNSTNIMNYSKMNTIADQHGFMVCYPQGTSNLYTGMPHWNANLKEMHKMKSVVAHAVLTSFQGCVFATSSSSSSSTAADAGI